MPQEDDYMVYTYTVSRLADSVWRRVYVDPVTGEHMPLRDHIVQTLRQIGNHREGWREPGVQLLGEDAELGTNDARGCAISRRERLLAEVVRQGAMRFRGHA